VWNTSGIVFHYLYPSRIDFFDIGILWFVVLKNAWTCVSDFVSVNLFKHFTLSSILWIYGDWVDNQHIYTFTHTHIRMQCCGRQEMLHLGGNKATFESISCSWCKKYTSVSFINFLFASKFAKKIYTHPIKSKCVIKPDIEKFLIQIIRLSAVNSS
jgi:hypothetical protein